MSIVVHLHDYSRVRDDVKGETLVALAKLYEVQEKDVAETFCQRLEHALGQANSKDIHLVNVEEEKGPPKVVEFNGEWRTQGYVGVIQFFEPHQDDDELEQITVNIHSRFDTDNSSRFLMYVFESVFSARGKIYEEMHGQGKQEVTWDYLLMMVFVRQLHEAMKKGMYRQYRDCSYCDSRVRGRVDVARYIQENGLLFNGNVAYTTREYTVNNSVNKLLLKAFDCLDRKYHAALHNLIARDDVVRRGIQVLKSEVEDWQSGTAYATMRQADKKIVQHVYRNYEPLRQTAIAILKRMGINAFTSDDNVIAGMLVDMPKLWEEFLHHTVFAQVTGRRSKYQQPPYPIINGARKLQPDFLLEEQRVVLDAKYKRYWGKTLQSWGAWESAREDVFQLLSYMGVFNCLYGGVIFPVQEGVGKDLICDSVEEMRWPGRQFVRIPYVIPDAVSAQDFRRELEENGQHVATQLKALIEEAKKKAVSDQ